MKRFPIFNARRRNHGSIHVSGRRAASGFTLVEVLIAFLVMAVGLVGMASLHLTSVSSAHSSYLRSIASSIALDLEEHLWLEVANMAGSGCPDPANAIAAVQGIWGNTAGGDNGGGWTTNKLATLPGIARQDAITFTTADSAAVTADSIPFWTRVQFTLTWAEARFNDEAENDSQESFTFESRVVCRPADPTP